MYPHRIRLRGPWECELADSAGGRASAKFSVTFPARLSDEKVGAGPGRLRLRRRFGWLAPLGEHERVWLTFAGLDGHSEVMLNDTLLGEHEGPEPFEFEVSRLLRHRNELVVEVKTLPAGARRRTEVSLEVRCTAFLRQVEAQIAERESGPRLRVVGEIVGTSDRPLELYVLWAGSTISYTTIEPAPAGKPFEVVVDGFPTGYLSGSSELNQLRVELINGASVWYTWTPDVDDE